MQTCALGSTGRGDFLIPSWVPWESPHCSPMGTTGKRRNWDLEGGKKTVEVRVEQMLSRAALKSSKGTRASLKLLEGHHGAGRAVGESPWAEKVPLGWGVPAEAPGVTALGATAEGQAWYKSCRLRRKKKGACSFPSQVSKCIFPLDSPLRSTAIPLSFTTQGPAHSRARLGTEGDADTICSF